MGLLAQLLFIFSTWGHSASPVTLHTADALFENQSHQQALVQYQELAGAKGAADERLKAAYRATECLALLFRYAEAFDYIAAQSLPEDARWKARFLWLRAETALGYLRRYDASQDEEPAPADSTRRSRRQWEEEVANDFESLFKMKAALATVSLKDEGYFIDLTNADLEKISTLWDFVVSRWTTQLLTQARPSGPGPTNAEFLREEFSTPFSSAAHPRLKAAALMESAFELGGSRPSAWRWRVERVLIPFRDGNDDGAEHLAERKAEYKQAAQRIERWLPRFASPRLAAEAAFEAAGFYQSAEALDLAVNLCRRSEKLWPDFSKACTGLRAGVERPYLTLENDPREVGGKKLRLRARNLKQAYSRWYATTVSELGALSDRKTVEDWSSLRQLDDKGLRVFLGKTATALQSHSLTTPAPYAQIELGLEPPKLAPGLYVVIVASDESIDPGRSLVAGSIVNFSRLALVGSSGASTEGTLFHAYTIDPQTGAPLANTELAGYWRVDWGTAKRMEARTDGEGRASLSPPAPKTATRQQHSLDLLASTAEGAAFWGQPLYFYSAPDSRVRLFIDTDRPIYRPGQKVLLRVTAVAFKEGKARQPVVYKSKSIVSLTLSGPGGDTLSETKLTLNELGSGQAKITLPTGKLLGDHAVTAKLIDGKESFTVSTSVSVEEYKRPDYELRLDAAPPLRYGKEARLSGKLNYYFGAPVVAAPVTYRLYRQPHFFFWDFARPSNEKEELAQGELTSDGSGSFSLAFSPVPGAHPGPSELVLEVTARDPGGRTLSASKRYVASDHAYELRLEANGFLQAGKNESVRVSAYTLSGDTVQVRGKLSIYRLNGGASGPPAHSFETQFEGAKVGAKLAELELDTAVATQLPPLDEGVYAVEASVEDPWGTVSSKRLVVASVGEKSPERLALDSVTLIRSPNHQVGDTAHALLGSRHLNTLCVELWRGTELVSTRWLKQGLAALEVPVGAEDRGGLTVRWFGFKDFALYSGEGRIEVPWQDKQLSLKLTAPSSVPPRSAVDWKLQARGPKGGPVTAEAMIRVFDRSLEAYASLQSSWVGALYGPSPAPQSWSFSVFPGGVTELPVDENWLRLRLGIKPPRETVAEAPKVLPLLRSQKERPRGRMRLMEGNARFAAMPQDAPMAKSTSAADAVPVRSNFAETAYFAPQLRIAGTAQVRFTLPDQLTSWRFQALALTRELEWGLTEHVFETRKDLALHLIAPRFLREGDRAVLKTVLHNQLPGPQTGSVRLELFQNGGALPPTRKPFQIAKLGTHTLDWPIALSSGLGELRVRATLTGAGLSDAEEITLPILPARVRVVDSQLITLDGQETKKLAAQIPRGDARFEEATLQLEPELATSLLNALPSLVATESPNTEQILDRYIPLTVMSRVFGKHPELAAAVKALPLRDSITPAWSASDSRRLMELSETPWKRAAQGEKTSRPLLSWLRPEKVAETGAEALKQLESRQSADGGFPWFPGGRPDVYLTLLVLNGLAEAASFEVPYPQPLVQKAYDYVLKEMPRHLEPSESEAALLAFAAYVVSNVASQSEAGEPGRRTVTEWLTLATKEGRTLLPLSKAHLALAYLALGKKEAAETWLERAMDGARRHPTAGLYWTPEKLSWLWYSDSVEKHAFFLHALLRIKPRDPRAPELVKWLLFNRKGNEWKSSRTSAAAVFSLVDWLKSTGTSPQRYRWQWQGRPKELTLKATDALTEPLRWTSREKPHEVVLSKNGPGLAFASLTSVFSVLNPQGEHPDAGAVLALRRSVFRRKGDKLEPLADGSVLDVGDSVEVQLRLQSASQFEYVSVQAPRAAGFEAERLTSQWNWSPLAVYEETRDSRETFFVEWLPQGECVLKYRLRATTPGSYWLGPAVAQSLYSPDLAAYTPALQISVR